MNNNYFTEQKQKFAVVDIGANSVRMNIYDIDLSTGSFSVCDSARSMLGLAAYSTGGRLTPDGEGKLFSVLREYLARANSVPADSFSAFATASLRGLENSDKVLSKIKNKLGIDITIISGDEEAGYDFEATRAHFGSSLAPRGVVIDMGGGSTEFVSFSQGNAAYSASLKIGCLALSKKYVKNPPEVTPPELEQIKEYVKKTLSEHRPLENCGGTAYLIGGTARACARIFSGISGKNAPLDGYRFTPAELSIAAEALYSDGARGGSLVKKYSPDRALTVTAGVLALREIIGYVGADGLIVSGAGVREGFLAKMISDIQKTYRSNNG